MNTYKLNQFVTADCRREADAALFPRPCLQSPFIPPARQHILQAILLASVVRQIRCRSIIKNKCCRLIKVCMTLQDKDPSSRWEHLRDLLESLSECEGVDKDAWGTCPSTAEGKHSLASFWVHVLQDDLKCWLRACPNASQSLADKQDMPLMARLLWPHVQPVGHINASCRELIRIHLKALVPQNLSLCSILVAIDKHSHVTKNRKATWSFCWN